MDDQQSELDAARQNFISNLMDEASFRMRLIFLGLNAKEVQDEVSQCMPKRTQVILQTIRTKTD